MTIVQVKSPSQGAECQGSRDIKTKTVLKKSKALSGMGKNWDCVVCRSKCKSREHRRNDRGGADATEGLECRRNW